MSASNLEPVRAMFAAVEAGDYTTSAWAHPDVELVMPDGPAPGSWTGVPAMAEAVSDFLGAWDEYRAEPEEYIELDDGRILVLVSYYGRGKRSGVDLRRIGAQGAVLFTVRDGKVAKLVRYWDRRRAFADLGLARETQ